jgi:YD repeat-containing protein
MSGNFPALPDKNRFLLFSLLLMAGVYAGTQDADFSGEPGSGPAGEPAAEVLGLDGTGVEVPGLAGPGPEDLPPEAPRWFRSNAAGMALEEMFSRLAALRNEYALVIDSLSPEELPEILVPYHEPAYRIEVHILYKNGGESRRQWIFRDAGGAARLAAVFNQENPDAPEDDGTSGETGPAADGNADADRDVDADADADSAGETAEAAETEGEGQTPTGRAPLGFIETYNHEGWITAERLFREEGEEVVTGFFYHNRRLISAEVERKTRNEEGETVSPVYTDLYRYNRAGSLRAVERIYHEDAADTVPVRLIFPHMILNAAADKEFISPGISYGSDFLEEQWTGSGYRSLYTTDERGRILTETREDDKGTVVGELQNNWSGDRLASVVLKTGEEERRAEYEYDQEGNRISERNYRNGVLERTVRSEGKREIEELYMNGAVILRAVWEEGRKISEERVRSKQ